ncbi:hypothetical protein OEZ86_013486 [Tetradesmus obliquus]|nr:hypothetical protein OEZ86_013486 [Tetradesmus obliquus]
MGLDGGTKMTRSDVLRGQSWRLSQADGSRSTRGGCVTNTYQERTLDPAMRRLILWSCCALSGLPLAAPIVADLLGQLMNRQAVLEHLLAARGASVDGDESAQLRYSNQQRAAAGTFDHLKSLKDVFTVNLTPKPVHELQQQQQQQQEHMEAVRQQLKAKAAAKAAAKEVRAAEEAGKNRKRAREALEGGGSGAVCAVAVAVQEQQQQQQQQQQLSVPDGAAAYLQQPS